MKSTKHLSLVLLVGSLLLISYSTRCLAADDPVYKFKDYNEGSSTTKTPSPGNDSPATPADNYPAQVGYRPSAVDDDPKNMSAPPRMREEDHTPRLRVDVEPREAYGLGCNINLYGGAVAFQDGSVRITSPGASDSELRNSTHSTVGGVAGLKLGFTWASFGAIAAGSDSQANLEPDLIEPYIGGDFFWSTYRYKASGTGTTNFAGAPTGYDDTLRANANFYTLCLEPMIKFNLGAFRPYLGFGVGGSYIDMSHASLDGNIAALGASGGEQFRGSSTSIDFTAEALAGFEYFFDPHWALTFDYKFLYFVSPTFHDDVPGSSVRYHLPGLSESMFTSGISYYF